jgi:1,2-phenylacetyl-CoA epoxidase PaaB subunit
LTDEIWKLNENHILDDKSSEIEQTVREINEQADNKLVLD